MPTAPSLRLLDRSRARTEAAPIAEVASPLLVEIVNFGTVFFDECNRRLEGTEHGFPVLTFMLHILEAADGVQELVEAACGWPAVPIVRSEFEALLGLDYLLQDDTVRRARCWWVSDTHRHIDTIDALQQGTERFRQLSLSIARDKTMTVPQPVDPEKAAKLKEGYAKTLSEPSLVDVEPEYQSTRKRLKKTPAWFSLFDGPRNIEALAAALNRSGQYGLLYRDWSGYAHAADMSRHITITPKREAIVTPLRNRKILVEVVFRASEFALDAMHLLGGALGLKRELSDWFEREVKSHLEALNAFPARS